MADFDLETARKRCEAATPRPWISHGMVSAGKFGHPPLVRHQWRDDEGRRCSKFIASCESRGGEADAEFIAHARADLPEALDEIERLQEENRAQADNTEYWMVRTRRLEEENATLRRAMSGKE